MEVRRSTSYSDWMEDVTFEVDLRRQNALENDFSTSLDKHLIFLLCVFFLFTRLDVAVLGTAPTAAENTKQKHIHILRTHEVTDQSTFKTLICIAQDIFTQQSILSLSHAVVS